MSSTTPAKGRILLGEDVRLISYRMRLTLEQAGYTVHGRSVVVLRREGV